MIFTPFEERTPREQAEKDERLFESLDTGGFQEIVDSIQAGACITSVDPSGCYPIHYAAGMDNSKCLDYLIECDANVDTRDYAGWTPLHIACGNGSLECVESLLQQNAEFDLEESTGGSTALHIAASRGQNEVLMRLLECRANINLADRWGFTPLCQAAINEWTETCKILLQNGAEVNKGNLEGRTPLQLAVSSGNLVTVKLLVEYPSALTKERKRGIVEVICEKLKLLPLDLGYVVTDLAVPISNVETRDWKGRTALDVAVELGLSEIAEYLRPFIAPTEIMEHAVSRHH